MSFSSRRIVLFAGLLSSQVLADTTQLNKIHVDAGQAVDTSHAIHAVNRITRADILASPAKNLADLLAQESGIDIRRRGASGIQADTGIRGSSFEQTQVLLNGAPIHNPQTGHHNLDAAIPLEMIERIEVISGPAGIQQDGTATGGSINIVTRDSTETEAGITLAGGSNNSRELGLYGGGGTQNSSHLVSATISKSSSEHSHRPNDASTRQANYAGSYRWQDVNLKWGLGASRKDFGAWGFYSEDYPDARETTHSYHSWLTAEHTLGSWNANHTLYWNHHQDDFLTRIPGFDDSINHHKTHVAGVKSQWQRTHHQGTTVLGASGKREDIDSNALLKNHRHQGSVQIARQQQITSKLSAEAIVNGVSYSDYQDYVLPSLALSYQFTNAWRGFANAARSAREPSYTELYMSNAADQGDADLKVEAANFYELGVEHRNQQHQLSATAYQRDSHSWIDWTKTSSDTTWQAENLSRYHAQGLELAWRQFYQWRWLAETRLSYDAIHASARGERPEYKYALRIPKETWRAQATVPLLENVQLQVSARQPQFKGQKNATLLSAKLEWNQNQWRAWLDADNILDKDIVETGFAPIPGRWFMVGVGYDY